MHFICEDSLYTALVLGCCNNGCCSYNLFKKDYEDKQQEKK